MGIEQQSQEFGTVTIGGGKYDAVRSPPSWNIEITGGGIRVPTSSLIESVRVEIVRGTRPDTSARICEIEHMVEMWHANTRTKRTDDAINAGISAVLPDKATITRVRDIPTGQMVEVAKGAMILMDHESVRDGVIRMRY